jgi:ribose 5-phosphate isomerase B
MKAPIAIGSDHAGYEYKEAVKSVITRLKYEIDDKGPDSADSVDYPDFAHPVAKAVEIGQAAFGILICGSGNGVCMTANKHNVRAALCWKKELAILARSHNDANILCIPARFISLNMAKAMIKAFLTTPFDGGRHANRVNKIIC